MRILFSLVALTSSVTCPVWAASTPLVTSTIPAQLLTGGTQTLDVMGSGFLSTSVVTLGGRALITTYYNADRIRAQVPVADNATGTLALEVQTPGVAQNASFKVAIAPNTVTVVGSAGFKPVMTLGSAAQFGKEVSGSLLTSVTWSVVGGGSISTAGVYTAPSSMPASAAVTIVATLTSNPSVRGTYQLTLNSPVPVISTTNPSQAIAGTTIPIEICGSNFVPGIVILANNVVVPSTFESSDRVVAQITAAAGSTSNISVVAQNPSPVAGAASAYALGTAAIKISAFNPNGSANNGKVQLGVPITFTTSDNSTSFYTRTWTLQGAGNLTHSGSVRQDAAYTPPQTMPASPTVTVTASIATHISTTYTSSNPIMTTTFNITLENPVPTVTSTTPTQLLTDETQTVTLTGSGFVPGMTVAYNGTTLPTTYVSYNEATVAVPVAVDAPSSLTLTVQNPAPNGGAGTTFTESVVTRLPAITGVVPLSLPAGATTAVTVQGTGFLPGMVILVNGVAVPTTYQSGTSVSASIHVPANATGSYSLQGQNPGNAKGGEFEQAISAPVSITAAARILDQTTFGPTTSLISHVQQEGVTAWLAEQLNTPQTVLPQIPAVHPSYCTVADWCFESEWWKEALTGNDQLRQRVAFALSELFVISDDTVYAQELDSYANMLAADAFTNWYTIMNDVTLSPGMGQYLNMLNSAAPGNGEIANENYARENMQLFNLGLNLINQDGTPQEANGIPIPTFTEAQVQAFARAYTGWTYANADGSAPSSFYNLQNFNYPMAPVGRWHDENSKTLLNGTVLPAGQTPQEDLAGALTNIFEHPNTAPFVSRQLIQHLVKGDPSPAYVSRVAQVFMNDGNGVRGDMRAVLTAILTDPEARSGDIAPSPTDGHLREPILWMTNVMRGLGYVNIDPNNYYFNASLAAYALGERVYESPSVFNFFPPSYVIPLTTLNSPEFGLENTGSVIGRLNMADTLVSNNLQGFNVDLSATSPLGQIAVSEGPAALVAALSDRLLYGTMDSNTAAAITSEISTVTNPAQQIRLAAYLTITSSEYKILH